MKSSLERVYTEHHATKRGAGFVLLGDIRGTFLKEVVGKEKRVLDIGCRDGALTQVFAAGNEVVGVDIDSEALERAQVDFGIETKQIDLNGEWGIEQHSFDVVVAAEVLEHLYYPSVVIGKAAQVLKPDGEFVGTIPNAFSFVNRLRYLLKQKKGTPLEDPAHINHFTVCEFESLLEQEFTEVKIAGFGRHKWLAHMFPQTFAYGLSFIARSPRP